MALYCIGDVHGCYSELKKLLKLVNFKPKKDELLFTGDLIGRGPNSLEVINFIMDLEDCAHVVLGNHDLNFLCIALGFKKAKKKDCLDSLLKANNLDNIVNWYLKQPLMYLHPTAPICLVHAGISPQWNLKQAFELAHEVESVLQNPKKSHLFLKELFGDKPNLWSDNLKGNNRLRYITNVFTRIRFCHSDLSLDFEQKSTPAEGAIEGLYPWYELRNKPFELNNRYTLIFGHWAALGGECSHPYAKNLDTGCVWGQRLTMWCFDTDTIYSVPSSNKIQLDK
jgi:bis(5'-nucleosyl)-tetraphosphatase (symmetrical)